MQDKYTITIKARRDEAGDECENQMYAAYICNQVYWVYSDIIALAFSSVEKAEDWFMNHKSELFADFFTGHDFDMSSIAIVKKEYTAVKTLEV